MNELFKEIVELSEKLQEKVSLLSAHIDREGLAAEEYIITLFRDDLLHTLENVKDLTDNEVLNLGWAIREASEVRRNVKSMVIFFDHKYLQFENLTNELNRFIKTIKREEPRYLFKTEAGVERFKSLITRPYEAKVVMDTENYNKKKSKLLSGEVTDIWQLIDSFKVNTKESIDSKATASIAPVITKEAVKSVPKIQETVVVKEEIVQEKVEEVLRNSSQNTVIAEEAKSKELYPKQNVNLGCSVSEILSNEQEVVNPSVLVDQKKEIRDYVIQGPNKGMWQLYSKKARKVVAEYFKMSHLLDFILNNRLYVNYEKGMDKVQIKQMTDYLK